LAGFAGVAVVLGRGPGRWSAADALRIRLLLTAAFTALFAPLVAIGSQWAGAGEDASVRLGAAALLIGQVRWGIIGSGLSRLEPSDRALFNPRLAAFFRVVASSSWVAQVVAISGVWRNLVSWLFLYGLLACLGYAAFGFVRLLFVRPNSE
jgi:hypothetical protein